MLSSLETSLQLEDETKLNLCYQEHEYLQEEQPHFLTGYSYAVDLVAFLSSVPFHKTCKNLF